MQKRKSIFGAVAFILTGVLTITAVDQGLKVADSPTEMPLQTAYPANYSELRKNVEFSHSFQTNSLGLRYKEIQWQKDQSKEYRVLLLGDSLTEGVGVEQDQTYAEIMERKLTGTSKNVSFINAGLRGVGPVQYARVFYNLGLKMNPDHVIVMVFANDVGDTPPLNSEELASGEGWLVPHQVNEYRTGIKKFAHALWPRVYMRTVMASKKLETRRRKDVIKESIAEAHRRGISDERIQKWVSELPPNWIEAANREEFNANILTKNLLQPNFWTDYLDIETPEAEKKLVTVLAIMTKMAHSCKEQSIPMSVIYAPASFQYDADYDKAVGDINGRIKREWLWRHTVFENRLSAWAGEMGLPFLDLTPYMRVVNYNSSGKCHYSVDGHWTAYGNEQVASIVLGWMQKTGTLPATPRKYEMLDMASKVVHSHLN